MAAISIIFPFKQDFYVLYNLVIRMIKRYDWKKWRYIAAFMALAVCVLCLSGCGRNVEINTYDFTESSQELDNPGRGFYRIHCFEITDHQEDYQQKIAEEFGKDKETRLSLIEINLQNYKEGAITEAGLANIEALLDALEATDKQLILRFLYDWDGKGEIHEPANLETILLHMEQVGPVLRGHHKQIFTLQGLFIGNWGEMNGTKFLKDEDLSQLAFKLAAVTDASSYLAVRMPAQWRRIIDNQAENQTIRDLKTRLGLFNDGMLGNESDYGTYGTESTDTADWKSSWSREDELEFQNELCGRVPNGGEVIHENAFNDLERAIEDLSTMRVTYLNQDYDKEVFQKWAGEQVLEQGCFSGMDGLTYIKRHLGYRLLITDVSLEHHLVKDLLSANITFKNVGFAPLYKDAEVQLSLYSEEKDHLLTYEVPQNLRKLLGGKQAEESLTIYQDVPLKELSETSYKVYVSLIDSQTGKNIFLANEQEAGQYGYLIGTIDID